MHEILRESFEKSLRPLNEDTTTEELEEALRNLMSAVVRRGKEIDRTLMRLAAGGVRLMNDEEKLAVAENQLKHLLSEEKSKEIILSTAKENRQQEEENVSLMCDDRSGSPDEVLFDSVPDESSANLEETVQASSESVYYFYPLDDDVPALSTPPNRRSLIDTLVGTISRAPSRSRSRIRKFRE